ncbi:type II secretion system protein N [Halomonas elongata]|uniref:type II secretion system protein N n=1 Tax=Halomonas elongata TaxID=2746 RepID=UPI0023B05315|nr:type II secretion system protein N [Halomonas elongata]
MRRWLGWLSNMLLAWLAALVIADVVALNQPVPSARDNDTPLSSSAPLPIVASRLWQADHRPASGLDDTQLPLSLVGSFRTTPLGHSLVVVATPQGQVVVRPGDVIMETVKLASIDEQGLILDNDGRRERLRASGDDTKTTGIRRLNTP